MGSTQNRSFHSPGSAAGVVTGPFDYTAVSTTIPITIDLPSGIMTGNDNFTRGPGTPSKVGFEFATTPTREALDQFTVRPYRALNAQAPLKPYDDGTALLTFDID